MVGGVDGLQLDSSSYALRRYARRHFCLGPVFFIIAPSSGKMAGALWPKPQRRWQTVGKGAAFDRPSAAAATPKIPPGGTACSAPFAPALSTSSRLPSESSPTTEKMRAKKLVALGETPARRRRDARPTLAGCVPSWLQIFRAIAVLITR